MRAKLMMAACLAAIFYILSPSLYAAKPLTAGRRALVIYNPSSAPSCACGPNISNTMVNGGSGFVNLLSSAGAFAGIGFNFTVDTLAVPADYNLGQPFNASTPSYVTRNAALPLTPQNYCLIIDARFRDQNVALGATPNQVGGDTIVPAEIAAYAAYVQAGGGLMITGDNYYSDSTLAVDGFISRMQWMNQMINAVASSGIASPNTFKVGPVGANGAAAGLNPYSLETNYNPLASAFLTTYAGYMDKALVGSAKTWATMQGQPMQALALAWQGADLMAGYTGRMLYWGDNSALFDWGNWSNTTVNEYMMNAVTFLFHDTCCTAPATLCAAGPEVNDPGSNPVIACFQSTADGYSSRSGSGRSTAQDRNPSGGGSILDNEVASVWSDFSMFTVAGLPAGTLNFYSQICFSIYNATGVALSFQLWDQSSGGFITSPSSFAVTAAAGWQDFCLPFDASKPYLNATSIQWRCMTASGWTGKVYLDAVKMQYNCGTNPMVVDPACCTLVTPTFTLSFTPTFTRTFTPSFTPTPTWTLTRTPTLTPSPTLSHTPTFTVTLTPTPTVTSTPSLTPSPSPTWTLTRTPTSTATDTITPGPTPTYTLTATPTATKSSTPTFSDTYTPTPSSSPTLTRTPTLTWTPTPTATPTITETSLFSPTSTMTFSSTFTQTITFSPSPTPSDTATPSPTFSVTSTLSDSPTQTPSRTVTPTLTMSPSFSPSPSFTQTAVPVPLRLVISLFNSAGERVKTLFSGGAQVLPTQLQLSQGTLVSGEGRSASLTFPGLLSTGGNMLAWLGDNDNGQLVTSGEYYFKAEYTDAFGKTTAMIAPVQILNPMGEQRIGIYNSAGELVFSQSLSSTAGNFTDLEPDSPPYRFKLKDGNGAQQLWTWNGIGDNGKPVETGVYELRLLSSQRNGSPRVLVRSISVIKDPNARPASAIIVGPNPWTGTGPIVIDYPGLPGNGARAVLNCYDLAGELVASASDSSQLGRFLLDGKSLSGGIFLLEFVQWHGNSVLCRSVKKFAVIR